MPSSISSTKGKGREGSIRAEVDSSDVAWSLLMFAWAEDVARLMGVDQLITSGASNRVFRHMLADVAAPLRTIERAIPSRTKQDSPLH